MGLERLFQVDLRLCGIREWVSVHGMGWGGGEEGRIKLNPLIFFPFGVHIKEGYHVGIYWLVRLHHISLIPYRDEQKRNRGTNAENSKDEWPSLHRLPPFLPCKYSSQTPATPKPCLTPAPFITNSLDTSCPALPPSVLPPSCSTQTPPFHSSR